MTDVVTSPLQREPPPRPTWFEPLMRLRSPLRRQNLGNPRRHRPTLHQNPLHRSIGERIGFEHEDDISGEQMVLFDAMCASVQWRTNDGAHLVVEADGTMSG